MFGDLRTIEILELDFSSKTFVSDVHRRFEIAFTPFFEEALEIFTNIGHFIAPALIKHVRYAKKRGVFDLRSVFVLASIMIVLQQKIWN